jgi:hypothetical protein
MLSRLLKGTFCCDESDVVCEQETAVQRQQPVQQLRPHHRRLLSRSTETASARARARPLQANMLPRRGVPPSLLAKTGFLFRGSPRGLGEEGYSCSTHIFVSVLPKPSETGPRVEECHDNDYSQRKCYRVRSRLIRCVYCYRCQNRRGDRW